MKIAIRALILLLIVLWLGGIMFFPIVAATAFSSLPDTHVAGTIVGQCLRVLHQEGLFCGAIIVLLLLVAQFIRAMPRSVAPAVVLTLVMLALTAFSQFSILPRMDRDRVAAGGAIDAAPPGNPYRTDFNKLHGRSEKVEEGILLAGIALVIVFAANYPRTEPRP